MKPETLNYMTQALLGLARESAWNKISQPCMYVIRKFDERQIAGLNLFEIRKLRKQVNRRIPILSLDAAAAALSEVYDKIHLIELYVFEARKIGTTIEILVVEKDEDLRNSKGEPPTVHCKVVIPPYIDSIPKNDIKPDKVKFDINWELGTFEYYWKMFWWKMKRPYPRLIHSKKY